jgi:hypothetical protein
MATKIRRRARPASAPTHVPYLVRCPAPLWKRLEAARWQLKKESRNRLILDAIAAYLDQHHIATPGRAAV